MTLDAPPGSSIDDSIQHATVDLLVQSHTEQLETILRMHHPPAHRLEAPLYNAGGYRRSPKVVAATPERCRTFLSWILRPGFVLVCTIPAIAGALPVASAPHAQASAACVVSAASTLQNAERASSKLRHVLDEDDPCADSRGRGHNFGPLHPIGARPASPAVSKSARADNALGKQ